MNRRDFLQSAAVTVAAIGSPRGGLLAQSSPSTLPTTSPSPADAAILARFGSRGVRVHDPSSIVRCKDDYWLFFTGRGAPCCRSADLLHWERGPQAFTVSPPWVAQAVPANRGGLDFWAPDVARIGDRYLLYYSVSSWGRNTSAIALATSPTLDPTDPTHRWTDQGIVVQSSPADKFNAIDPAFFQDADGSCWLTFGSFWIGIKLIQLDPATGKRIKPDSPMYSLAHATSIEAPHLFRHGEHYYLIVNWGLCCRGVNSTYNLRIGRSEKVIGPSLDKDGVDLLKAGGTLLLDSTGPFIGPGQASVFRDGQRELIGMHYYDATRRGMSTLAISRLSWDAKGWPIVG
jgi:arabinan endo-1,5-alpha-L-arabinosidase